MWWMRFKADGKPFVITLRSGYSSIHGRYGLGYRDRGRVIAALRMSGELAKRGLLWTDLELVNVNGKTMDDMVNVPVCEGFALRHRVEKWYWSERNSGRVWYRRPGDVEGIWRRNEARLAIEEDRNERRSPGQQKLEMVRGFADSRVESMPNWLV